VRPGSRVIYLPSKIHSKVCPIRAESARFAPNEPDKSPRVRESYKPRHARPKLAGDGNLKKSVDLRNFGLCVQTARPYGSRVKAA
jgi:hypothetical protein